MLLFLFWSKTDNQTGQNNKKRNKNKKNGKREKSQNAGDTKTEKAIGKMITSPARARLLMPSFKIFCSPQTYAISVPTVILPKRNAKLGEEEYTRWAGVSMLSIKQKFRKFRSENK